MIDPASGSRSVSDRSFYVVNAVLSAAALALLAYLLLIRRGSDGAAIDLRFLPTVNAGLNALAATLLAAGFVAVKRRKLELHRALMLSAFAASTLFLVGYLAYHYVHGDTRYVGPHRTAYLTLLASHVVLSIPVVPLCLSAFYFAWQKRFETHRRVTRVLFPMWMYVSVTGVLVYLMLHGSPPAAP